MFTHLKAKILLVILCLLIGISCSKKNPVEPDLIEHDIFKVGVLVDLSGDFSSLSKAVVSAIEIAQDSINNFLEKEQEDVRVEIEIRDTQANPTVAETEMKALVNLGINACIGPLTSYELSQLKNYINNNDMLIVSPSSTAPSLAVQNDNIFRFCPNDVYQALVISKQLHDDKIKAVISVFRNEAYGNELVEEVKKDFYAAGGKQVVSIGYDPDVSDFSTILSDLNFNFEQLAATYDTSEIAVFLVSSGETQAIFTSALQYPDLEKMRWYGCDGNVLLPELIDDHRMAEFAVKTGGFVSCIYEEQETDVNINLTNSIQEKIGYKPESYALVAYDALWILMKTFLETNQNNVELLKQKLPIVAKNHFGVSGIVHLDENGDRKYSIYSYWKIIQDSNDYSWRRVSRIRP